MWQLFRLFCNINKNMRQCDKQAFFTLEQISSVFISISWYFLWKPNLQIFNCGSVSVQSLLFKRDHPTALTCRIQSPIGRNPSKQKEDPVFPFQKCQLSSTLSAKQQPIEINSLSIRPVLAKKSPRAGMQLAPGTLRAFFAPTCALWAETARTQEASKAHRGWYYHTGAGWIQMM